MSRTEYHRDYYWKNVHKRRRQRVESKKRCKWRDEEVVVGGDGGLVNHLMRSWNGHG